MEKREKLEIDSTYLKELIDYVSSSLVGKLMKKFEIVENRELLKSLCKETVYEEFRHFRDLLEAHNYGMDLKVYKYER